ncbi:MAG: 4-alpha-glucanotransferase [Planctomycetota bacterium]
MTEQASRPHLRALAREVGLIDSYVDGRGLCRETGDHVRTLLLAGLGLDGSTEECARESREVLLRRERERILSPVRVVQEGSRASRTTEARIPGRPEQVDWRFELILENGEIHQVMGSGISENGLLPLRHPVRPSSGYHRVRLELWRSGTMRTSEQALIVTPGKCASPDDLGITRATGLWSNLYSVRSGRNHGIGDVGDLKELVRLAGQTGADFVGVNPMHAIRNTSLECSPYSPLTRLYRNPLYISLPDVPELRRCPALKRRTESSAFRQRIEQLRAASVIDYDAVRVLKTECFLLLHRVFWREHASGATARGRQYRRFLEQEGAALSRFATFQVLEERFGQDFLKWPAAYRTPENPEVAAFQKEHRREVDYHCYLQFELDRQLQTLAKFGCQQGLRLGIYQDLAIAAVKDGADVWSLSNQFVPGVSLGAPPDGFTREGQIWNLPPLNPLALRETGYDHWTRLLRASFRHAGLIRIDHVIGLVRQYWIPDGLEGTDGALIRFPADDLFGILALESRRHDALVVGEDIGTVPEELPGLMQRYGLLSSRVFLFDTATRRYPRNVFLSTTTHDHTPMPGFLRGVELPLLRKVGLIQTDQELEQAREGRAAFRAELEKRLQKAGLLVKGRPPTDEELTVAVYRYLARSRAVLLAASLDDLAGETTPVNIPGVTGERYLCWSRRMTRTLEDLCKRIRELGGLGFGR